MKLILLFLLVTSCARFSNDYEEEDMPPILTQEELIQKLEGIEPTIKSVSPGKPYPVTPKVQVLANRMQQSCCIDVCRGIPRNVAREPMTKYIRCTCQDGRVFRVTRLRGKQ